MLSRTLVAPLLAVLVAPSCAAAPLVARAAEPSGLLASTLYDEPSADLSARPDCVYDGAREPLPLACYPSYRLVVVHADGSRPRILADCPASPTRAACTVGLPRFSPDGRRLAVMRDGHLAIADVATGRWHQYEDIASRPAAPAWSPDGRWIAVEQDSGLTAVRPDGSDAHHVAGGRQPTWTGRGAGLRLTFSGAEGVLRRVDLHGRREVRLTTRATAPASYTLGQDGRLVLERRGDLLTSTPGARMPRALVAARPGAPIIGPDLSPAADRLLYTVIGRQSPEQPTRMLDLRTGRTAVGPRAATTWSPDGTWLAGRSTRGLFVSRATVGAARRLVLDAPALSVSASPLQASFPVWAVPGRPSTRPTTKTLFSGPGNE